MKVHAYNDGGLAAEHDLATRLPYFERIYICLKGCKTGSLAGCMMQFILNLSVTSFSCIISNFWFYF